MQGKTEIVRLDKVLPRVEAPLERGLTRQQVRERLENGYANTKPESAEKTFGQVIKDNVFTYFNLVFTLLALCIVAVGSYKDLMFMTILLANCIIGIVQELRSKSALSKLTFMSAPKAAVIRDCERMTVPADETVLDDIVIFAAGNQIYADAIILDGRCQVNEALVTGESDEIAKTPGDTLLSGSFIVSGECVARLEKVGRDSFVSKMTIEAKKTGAKRAPGIVTTLGRLVFAIGIIILPIGAMMFYSQFYISKMTLMDAVVKTVAALIGMIPEGLFLLVSVALTVSVLRLAKRRTLVHEMGCVEMLARVDVLCVDKTGTITESRMEVKGTALLRSCFIKSDDIDALMTDYAANMPSDNETMAALQAYFAGTPRRRARWTVPFSSAVKYGGIAFGENESYLLGAPERILLSNYARYRAEIDPHSAQGYRVLLLAQYGGDIGKRIDESLVTPLALILLNNRVREQAPATFGFFARQGVKIIVISGDNPLTVSQIASEAGIDGAERCVDAAELTTDRKIRRAVKDYVVFGRVTPDQKRKLVRALKAAGHTVAMTGDGVNDVLALKDANCSIAMASGSEVASQVADIVLLDSDFSAMPAVVMEGRRVINNIQRSAALFLTKNLFSFLLAIITMALALPYPLSPTQLSIFNGLLIGAPSFVLALEPNKNIVKGRFLANVIISALPAGLTDFGALAILVILSQRMEIPLEQMSTMACIIIAFVGFLMLYKLSRPLNALRIALIICMFVGFVLGGVLFSGIFSLSALSWPNIWLTALFCAASVPTMLLLSLLLNGLFRRKKKDANK